jgi:hypothetical protein
MSRNAKAATPIIDPRSGTSAGQNAGRSLGGVERRTERRAERGPAPPRLLALVIGAAAGLAGCYIAVDSSNDSPPDPCPSGDISCADVSRPRGPSASDTGAGGTYGSGAVAGGGAGANRPGTGGSATGGSATGGVTAGNAPLPRAPAPPATCPAVAVSRFNELLIVDAGVTGDDRASNAATTHPWSFRQHVEALVGSSAEAAGSLADAWLAGWSTATEVPVSTAPGAARVPIEPRPAAQAVLRCPWLRQSPENACDTGCSSCRSRHLDLARAPFRLLAIANRIDLAASASPDAGGAASDGVACGTSGGEVRFVYTAIDPETRLALPFTVIFEYGIDLLPGETLRDWAAAWHDLGALPVGSVAYNARLDGVIARALVRATLRRVLTNEDAFGLADGLPWEMRQFAPTLTDSGTVRLVEIAMSGTPRLSLGATAELGQWIDDNAAAVLANENPLPLSMLAASAPLPTADFSWMTTARKADAGAAFNRNTCNGCHGGRRDATDVPFQHIAPGSDGGYYDGGVAGPSRSASTRISRFLHNPGSDDELGRRERKLASILCTPCAASVY